MKTKYAVPVVLITGLAACVNSATASDEFFGAVLGGATGAIVGHALGGHDGAVAGGALGAVVGAVAASDRDRQVVYGPPPPVVYDPPPVVYEEPRLIYAPPPMLVQSPPVYYRYYGRPGAWRRHDGRWGHRGW